MSLARGLARDFASAGCQVPVTTIANRTLLGAGYSVARALHYARLPDDATIDGNDLEDYFLCLHLGAASGRVMVTNDAGTRDAIQLVDNEFVQAAAQNGQQFHLNARFIGRDEFRAEAQPTPSA